MQNLHEALSYQLRGKTHKTIRKNVVLRQEHDGALAVYYHLTPVVTVHLDGSITLTSGGWHTFTTKKVINEYLPEGWALYQKNYEWYLQGPGATYEFIDRMTLEPVVSNYTVGFPTSLLREEAV